MTTFDENRNTPIHDPDQIDAWQSIVVKSSEFLTILDTEYRLLYVNHPQPGLENYHGSSVFDYIDPEFHNVLRHSIDATLNSGLPHHFESIAKGPDGENSYYSNWVTVLNSKFQKGSIAIIGTDITHTRRMERAVLSSEERYRRIFDSVPTSIIAVDKNGTIVDVNPYHLKIIGKDNFKKSDYLGKNITQFPSVVSAGLSEEYKKVLQGVPFNMKDTYFPNTSGGSDGYFNIFGQPQYDGDQIIGAIYMHENITHLKEAIELKQRLTTILESTSDFVGIADVQGKTIYINGAIRKFLGIGPDDDVTGISISNYHSEAESQRILNQGIPYASQHGIWRGETLFRSVDGKEIPTSQIIIAHKSSSGSVNYFSTIARDISEQKANEQELLKYREHLEELVAFRTRELEGAMRELESFAYSVSHDLRSPLRSIASFSQILVNDYVNNLEPTAIDYLQRVQKNAIYMSKLIDEMLNLSRISRHEFLLENICLSDFVEASLEKLRLQNPSHTVTKHIAPNIHGKGDALLLSIMIDNLISNAWKFTTKTDNPMIEFGEEDQDGEKVFYIRDNGIGFDMQYANKLFKPFSRLHHAKEFEGHGMGLATVMRIINRHRGSIWVDSTEHQGSTFFFTLNKELTALEDEKDLI